TQRLQRDRAADGKRLADQQRELQQLRERDLELARLRRELDRLKSGSAGAGTDKQSDVSGELPLWSARIRTLKERLEQTPERKIPELKLLNELDWLEVTKQADLNSEAGARRSFSALRKRAKREFAELLRSAFHEYAEAHHDELPARLGD